MTCSSDRSRDNALCSRAGQPAVSGPSLPMPQPRPTPLQQPSWRDTYAKLARQHSRTISRTHYIVGCRTAQIWASSSRPHTHTHTHTHTISGLTVWGTPMACQATAGLLKGHVEIWMPNMQRCRVSMSHTFFTQLLYISNEAESPYPMHSFRT